MAKQYLFDTDARQRIASGVQQLTDAVRVTLGPAGRNVICQKSFGGPTVTRDGVTVAKEVELEDPFENMGAKLVQEVATKTNDTAGDGTTTATVLAESIICQGQRFLTAGAHPNDLRTGIDLAVRAVVDQLSEVSKKIKGRAQIASVGASHKEMGYLSHKPRELPRLEE